MGVNMKKTLLVLFVLVLALATPRLASASSITQTFNPADVFMGGQVGVDCTGNVALNTTSAASCESLTWTHTILPAFNTGTDVLSLATITITTYNAPTGNNNQSYDYVFDLLTGSVSIPDGSAIGSPNLFGLNVITQMADGNLNVMVTSANGNHDFYFAQSVVNATWSSRTDQSQSTSPVAEPEGMVLFGTGLAGLAMKLRRRKTAKA